MAVRKAKRRGKRRLIIDIRYTPGRYREDAEVQTLAAARAEERRRLAALALTGSPLGAVEHEAPEPTHDDHPPREPLPTFEAVTKTYLADYAVSRLKPSTRHGYAIVISTLLVPRLGSLQADAIGAAAVRQLDAELLGNGARPSTRRNVQTVLRSVRASRPQRCRRSPGICTSPRPSATRTWCSAI
jgi:hypothetical protein